MKRTLLLSTLLVFTFFGLAQDTGGEMMEDMTGGMMTGGEMTGGMSGGMTGGAMMTDDAEFDSLIPGSTTGGDMSMTDTASMTIAEVVAANPDFGILAQLLGGAAGLTETLNGEGPFTVFAPNDDAFLPFTNNEIVSLLGDTDALTNILTYHVVAGELTSTDLTGMTSVTTLQGGDLSISEGAAMSDMTGGMMTGGDMSMTGGMTGGEMSMGPSLMVNGANVVSADIITSNGVIHVIDTVLMPSN